MATGDGLTCPGVGHCHELPYLFSLLQACAPCNTTAPVGITPIHAMLNKSWLYEPTVLVMRVRWA